MVFRFLLISDEVEGFKREIQINSDDTFYSLHKTIIESVGYKEGEMSSFFMCTDDWEQKEEITLVEMDTYSDVDSYTMEDTTLDQFLEDESQRLIYVFDYLNERSFFMELREIITGKHLEKAICTQSAKDAPIQILEIEEEPEPVKPVITPAALLEAEDDFFDDEDEDDDIQSDDEDFDMDELDADGFDGLDGGEPSEEEALS